MNDGFDAKKNLEDVIRNPGVPSHEELDEARKALVRMTDTDIERSDDERAKDLRIWSMWAGCPPDLMLHLRGAADRLTALSSEVERLRGELGVMLQSQHKMEVKNERMRGALEQIRDADLHVHWSRDDPLADHFYAGRKPLSEIARAALGKDTPNG